MLDAFLRCVLSLAALILVSDDEDGESEEKKIIKHPMRLDLQLSVIDISNKLWFFFQVCSDTSNATGSCYIAERSITGGAAPQRNCTRQFS